VTADDWAILDFWQAMSLPLFWLLVGGVLCVMEFVLPTAFIEATLGVSALVAAVVALVIPQFSIQVVIWMVLSVLANWALKRFVPKKTPYVLADSTEARTLTAIAAGQTGRVLYEGNSWQARCDDQEAAIGADEPVIVVGRKGNTLFIMPEHSIRS
jgi:membrane protein implicated in regulation of membrane protease activity